MIVRCGLECTSCIASSVFEFNLARHDSIILEPEDILASVTVPDTTLFPYSKNAPFEKKGINVNLARISNNIRVYTRIYKYVDEHVVITYSNNDIIL